MSLHRSVSVLAAFTLLGLAAPAAASDDPTTTGQPPDSTRLISRARSGEPGNDSSYAPSVSNNGRLVTYASYASDLVRYDDNHASDVFVYDRRSGGTNRVSVDMDGNSPNDDSWRPQISGRGRFVVFLSRATDLVPVETDGVVQAYLFDLVERTTTL